MVKVYEKNVKKPCAWCNSSLNVLLIKYEQDTRFYLISFYLTTIYTAYATYSATIIAPSLRSIS